MHCKPFVSEKLLLNTQIIRADEPLKTIHQSPGWQNKVISSGFAKKYPSGLVLHLSSDGTNAFNYGNHSIWPVYAEVYLQ